MARDLAKRLLFHQPQNIPSPRGFWETVIYAVVDKYVHKYAQLQLYSYDTHKQAFLLETEANHCREALSIVL